MPVKLDDCPVCGARLRQAGYDAQECHVCAWGPERPRPRQETIARIELTVPEATALLRAADAGATADSLGYLGWPESGKAACGRGRQALRDAIRLAQVSGNG